LLMLKTGVEKTSFQLRISKRRVREVRSKAERAGYMSGLVPVPLFPLALFPDEIDHRSLRSSDPDRALLSQKQWIEEHLTLGWKPVSVFEELKIPGISRSSFYRFLDRHGLDELADEVQAECFIPPIHHDPGEALILDWGKLRDVVDPETGKKRTLWAFVGVLGFSRYMMIKLVWSNDVPSTLNSIEQMLKEIGGSPKRVTSDNPKCFATEASKTDPLLNPAFLRFSQHYRFVIECLPPHDPEKKGKVERMMPFARRLFETYPKDWVSLTHAQTYLDSKLEKANQRIHGTTRLKPLIVFLEKESAALIPLPSLGYEHEQIGYPTVRRDGFVRFENKYYAVGEGYSKKDAIVLGTKNLVSIYCEGKLLEVYPRIKDPYQTHDIKDYLKKPWQRIEENNAFLLVRAKKIGPNVEEFVQKVLCRGNGFVDTRVIWGLLSLDKKYQAAQIDQCALEAMELGHLSSRMVERLLALKPKTPKDGSQHHISPDSQQSEFKFARSMETYKKAFKTNLH
jgi:hypothetical protein